MEIWKTIKGFENYEVSNFANVRNKTTNRILKQENNKGYLRVSLSLKGMVKRILVHRLVAINFINNKYKKPCVNHKDGNRLNNNLSNLEWVTFSENEIHSYNVLGKLNSQRKLTLENVLDIKNNCVKGINQTKKGNVDFFMQKYNVDRKTILNVLNKKCYA